MSLPPVACANSSGRSPISSDLERSETLSDESVGRSIYALTASMTTTLSDESQQAAETLTTQLKDLIARDLDKKNKAREKTYSNTLANLTADLSKVTQKNESLLNELDVVTRDLVKTILENTVLEVALRSTEEKLDKLDRGSIELEMQNSLLVGYVRKDLLKLAAASRAQDLLNQLKPSNPIDLEKAGLKLEELKVTLEALQQFSMPDHQALEEGGWYRMICTELISAFNDLQKQIEELKPLDQPGLGILLEGLRRHLILNQLEQVLQLLKECNLPQVQPILGDLERILGQLQEQVKQFIKPPAIARSSSWW